MLKTSHLQMKRTFALFALIVATLCEGATHTGAAGGPGGGPFADQPPGAGARIAAVIVRSGSWIDAVQILYQTPDGARVPSPRHGGAGGAPGVFPLEPDERITAISGHHGQYIHSIRIHTDKRASRAYGTASGTPFRIDVPAGRAMVGFVGRSGSYLDAIGLALGPDHRIGAAGSGAPSAAPSTSTPNSTPQHASPRLLTPPRVQSRVQEDQRYANVTLTIDLSAPAPVELIVGDHNPGNGRCFSPGYRPVLRSPSPNHATRHVLGLRNLPMATPYHYTIRIGAGGCESGSFTTATRID